MYSAFEKIAVTFFLNQKNNDKNVLLHFLSVYTRATRWALDAGAAAPPFQKKMYTFSYYKQMFSHSTPALKTFPTCTAPPQETFWIHHW